ncbi:hypothetical protein [Azospirillum ramasamyi]|uniref:Uncharacterized protein n=1 Tax=Azospirillum ramasamyi TaxID=682998 RepID=A0A2U9S8P6_9PROT|nr:hypothetical protein [Azospirillum ramasamyi]AWU95884.1 hypothetical protein DM194_16590 [Azospirillum ramasamyi]
MAVSNVAVFPQQLLSGAALTTGANATIAGAPDNTVALFTAPADGAEINSVTVLPLATCSATVAYLYASTDGGTTKRLLNAKLIVADTVSTTDEPKLIDFGYSDGNLLLAGNERLYVGTSVALANGFSWRCQGRGYTGA